MIGIVPERARELYQIPEGVQPKTGLAIGYAAEPSSQLELHKQHDLAPRTRKRLGGVRLRRPMGNGRKVGRVAASPGADVWHGGPPETGKIIVESPMRGCEKQKRRSRCSMKDQDKTKQQLVCEVDELRGQVAALEKSLQDTQSAAALHRRT